MHFVVLCVSPEKEKQDELEEVEGSAWLTEGLPAAEKWMGSYCPAASTCAAAADSRATSLEWRS